VLSRRDRRPPTKGVATMKLHAIKKWALACASGAVLLQVPGCTEAAVIVTGWASAITAGGVLFLIRKIME
jgi:hypothetical protein